MLHTPGPWRWEVNLKSRQMQLCGGRPRFDKTVMDFTRWGMSGARIRLLSPQGQDDRDLMRMENAEMFCRVVPGREHHADWFQTIDHPDARLIAAAPELLDALKNLLWAATERDRRNRIRQFDEFVDTAKAAIAKADGRQTPHLTEGDATP